VKAKLIENTQGAVERGAFGSPTFFVGKEMFFGKEQLREVEEMGFSGSRSQAINPTVIASEAKHPEPTIGDVVASSLRSRNDGKE